MADLIGQGATGGDSPPANGRESGTSVVAAWDWLAAEQIALAVAGSLDDAHAILIHLHAKVPDSASLASAIARGVAPERVWEDARFLASVRVMAANRQADLRRQAARQRSPRFRRPSGTTVAADAWARYPPYFRLVTADGTPFVGESAGASFEVADDAPLPDATVEATELTVITRAAMRAAMAAMRPADVEVLEFVYDRHAPSRDGARVDEALAALLTARGPRPVSRDAARRRLTDARVRLEDALVGAHRHVLLRSLHDDPAGPPPSDPTRTALVAYLAGVGRRPRDVVVDHALATVQASLAPAPPPWPNRLAFAVAVAGALRALVARHQSRTGAPFFADSRSVPAPQEQVDTRAAYGRQRGKDAPASRRAGMSGPGNMPHPGDDR